MIWFSLFYLIDRFIWPTCRRKYDIFVRILILCLYFQLNALIANGGVDANQMGTRCVNFILDTSFQMEFNYYGKRGKKAFSTMLGPIVKGTFLNVYLYDLIVHAILNPLLWHLALSNLRTCLYFRCNQCCFSGLELPKCRTKNFKVFSSVCWQGGWQKCQKNFIELFYILTFFIIVILFYYSYFVPCK